MSNKSNIINKENKCSNRSRSPLIDFVWYDLGIAFE